MQDDSKDGGGRVVSGTTTEVEQRLDDYRDIGGRESQEHFLEQLPSKEIKQMTCMARIVPYNPLAFPPSMEVSALMPQGYDCTDAGDRAKHSHRDVT